MDTDSELISSLTPDGPGHRFVVYGDSCSGVLGALWRPGDAAPWSSLHGASSWGAEWLARPDRWGVGHGKGGARDAPFRGREVAVWSFATPAAS